MHKKKHIAPPVADEGFSLIELIIALGLSSIILSAVISTFVLQKKLYEKQAYTVEINENIRAGMQIITSELMMAGHDSTGIAGAKLVSALENSLRFTADLNGDGDMSDSGEDIEYALDKKDSQITRDAQPIVENIRELTFKYYSFDGLELTQPVNADDVKRVEMRIEGEYAGISKKAVAQVALRNVFRSQ